MLSTTALVEKLVLRTSTTYGTLPRYCTTRADTKPRAPGLAGQMRPEHRGIAILLTLDQFHVSLLAADGCRSQATATRTYRPCGRPAWGPCGMRPCGVRAAAALTTRPACAAFAASSCAGVEAAASSRGARRRRPRGVAAVRGGVRQRRARARPPAAVQAAQQARPTPAAARFASDAAQGVRCTRAPGASAPPAVAAAAAAGPRASCGEPLVPMLPGGCAPRARPCPCTGG